jgi:ribosomal protein S18 acetylase RimI-like enzyme
MERAYSLCNPKCSCKSQIYFSILRKENEECLKKLNKSLFLVSYDDEYYNALFSSELNHSFLIHDDREHIGVTSFRVQGSDAYLYTFGLLPYLRGRGLGNVLFTHLESYIRNRFGTVTFSLHVHSSNGFRISSTILDYYADIIPASAHFMVKELSQRKNTIS